MSLITLPNEILFLITNSLAVAEVHSLLLTSRVFSSVLPPVLYRLAALDPEYALGALFHAAVVRNDLLIITILSKGRDIAVMKDHHRLILPYHTAPAPCSDETLEFVLAQGPNLVLQQGHGTCQWHALHWAAWRKNERFIHILLKNGADINKRDTSGRTVLHDTVWRRDVPIVKLLLEQGADMGVRDLYNRTAVDLADAYRYREIIQMMQEMHPQYFRGTGPEDNCTFILLAAASRGDEELVKLLVSGGAYLEIRDESGRTPLHRAAKEDRISMVRTLLSYGALLNPCDSRRQTPLHLASMGGNEDVARLLIERGADVNLRDVLHQSPEDLATQYRRKLEKNKERGRGCYGIDGLYMNRNMVFCDP